MKFFFTKNKKKILYKKNIQTLKTGFFIENFNQKLQIFEFSKFFSKRGSLLKNKVIVTKVIKNINYNIFYNNLFLSENYPHIKWIVDDIIQKKINFNYIFDITTSLIKPPFVIKSVLVPKKLRKKTKQKYLLLY